VSVLPLRLQHKEQFRGVRSERLFIHRSSAVSGIGQFVHPFSNLLWGSVVAVTAVSALLMGTAYTVARRFGLELHHAPLFELKESFLIIFSSLLQQGARKIFIVKKPWQFNIEKWGKF
jgi:hypothetical protein